MGTTRSVLVRGAMAGVVAATAVVLFFLLADLVRGVPLQTPAFLSSVLFGREGAVPGGARIALYTILHYTVFAALGAAVAWGLERARAPAALVLGVIVGFLLFDLVFYASIGLMGVDVVRELGWPTFLAGTCWAGWSSWDTWRIRVRIGGVGGAIWSGSMRCCGRD
jgi:hypothetical protein